jgi:PIN domain
VRLACDYSPSVPCDKQTRPAGNLVEPLHRRLWRRRQPKCQLAGQRGKTACVYNAALSLAIATFDAVLRAQAMKTVTDNLQEMADEISEMLRTLLLEHSSIYEWNTDDGPVVIIDAYGNYSYHELPQAGRQIQAKLLEEYRRFGSLLKVLLREQPSDALQQLEEAETVLVRTIEQQHTWCETTQEALDRATGALQAQLGLLNNLYGPTGGDVVYVPDTNALLYNPAIEKWEFDGVPRFTLVVTPTVLSELDDQKVNHRNEAVRDKAEKLIRQMKGYRQRGRLASGVPLVSGRSTILTIATEPNMQITLPWLDPKNNDDRYLATVIEIMRLRPRSVVLAVSRDINFQDKAELARIPFVEPPEPMTAP